MISINATLVVQVIQFLILTFVLNRILFQPILKLLNERATYIGKMKDQISDLELKSERLRKECSAIEDAGRRRAIAKTSQLKTEALSETREYINGLNRQVASMRAVADRAADEEIRKIRPLLPREASLLSEDIVEKVIGRRIKA